MTAEAQALGDALRAAAARGDFAAVARLWSERSPGAAVELALALPRVTALVCAFAEQRIAADKLEERCGRGLAAAFREPDSAPEHVGGEEAAAAKCLAAFFRGEAARHSGFGTAAEHYVQAWCFMRRLFTPGTTPALWDQERVAVDAAAFGQFDEVPRWEPVRAAVEKRLDSLVFLGLGGDTRGHTLS